MSETLSRLLETGSVNGQAALLPGGQGLSSAATGLMEQARTAVVLAAHLVADKARFKYLEYSTARYIILYEILKTKS